MKQVLLVDDDQAVLQIVSKWLGRSQETFTILTAEHGREALDILMHQPVDIVVTDLQMPVMDGFEFIAHLLSEQVHVPIIIMTAMAVSTVESRLQGVGAFPVIRKPLSLTTLHTMICNELNAQQQGVIQGLTLPAFLQLLEAERKSCALRVTTNGRVGYLYFCDGELFHAETGENAGEAAAYDIVLWETVKLQMAALPATPPPKTLQDRLMGVLMEAFRRRDEAEEARRQASATSPALVQPNVESRHELILRSLDKQADADVEQLLPAVLADERPLSEATLSTVELILRLADRLSESPVERQKAYLLAPELARRLAGEAPAWQAARLLRLFDGQLTLEEMINIVPDQSGVLVFLANGLKALDLLQEAHRPTQTASTPTPTS